MSERNYFMDNCGLLLEKKKIPAVLIIFIFSIISRLCHKENLVPWMAHESDLYSRDNMCCMRVCRWKVG
jgi:hypothetical protein